MQKTIHRKLFKVLVGVRVGARNVGASPDLTQDGVAAIAQAMAGLNNDIPGVGSGVGSGDGTDDDEPVVVVGLDSGVGSGVGNGDGTDGNEEPAATPQQVLRIGATTQQVLRIGGKIVSRAPHVPPQQQPRVVPPPSKADPSIPGCRPKASSCSSGGSSTRSHRGRSSVSSGFNQACVLLLFNRKGK